MGAPRATNPLYPKGAGIFIFVLRYEEICAENLEIPGFVQKKYFFLKSAGKMPILSIWGPKNRFWSP